MQQLRCDFANPPAAFRGAPFWSWNDRLDPAELVRQARDMKAHGMGGFFMHSREGLETVYMGPEWMACIRAVVQAAREEGLHAWLYDEDRWPSGTAGGLVPARGGDDFRAKMLTLEQAEAFPAQAGGLLAVFAAVMDGGRLLSARRLLQPDAARAGETLFIFRRRVSDPGEWFNDDTYSDNLNPEAVAAFLDITYRAYYNAVRENIGGAVPGIFTDEPNVFALRGAEGVRKLPWTDALPQLFLARRGYDLLDVLPWLFYEGEFAAKTRHDYWWTVSERFTEAYSKQLGEWCEAHGLAFTGHYLYENDLGRAILHGGAVMPHYRYQQVPGIDMLTEQNHEFLTIKQCSSVASQFGRQRVLSETYGCTGWEFTFEGQKWVGDWQYVLGVNLRCQHLALYSLRGCRKRDYPPAFNYNTTWWQYNALVEDYFARIGRVMSEGQAVRDVLVLHPVTSAWAMLGEGPESIQVVDEYGERLNDFARAVLATHYDFDFGDEQIMASGAHLEGNTLFVGRAPYKLVIIPPHTRTLLRSTCALLEEFIAAGGAVIAFDPPPNQVEAVPDAQLPNLWRRPGVTVLSNPNALNAALENRLAWRVSLTTRQGQQAASLLYMQRRFEDGRQAYFIVNGDRHNTLDVNISLEGSGCLEEWDALSGRTWPVAVERKDGKLHFETHFAPAASRLFLVDPSTQPCITAPRLEAPGRLPFDRHFKDPNFYIGPTCAFTRTDPNVLTLDKCQYRLGGGDFSAEMDVWRAQSQARERLGMRQNYYNGLPQRYKWALQPHPADGAPLELRFAFQVRDVPAGPVYLLLEGAQAFTIALNGQPVPAQVDGWYLDRAFHRVPLPPLRTGLNHLTLSCAYTSYMELEDCYLLGDFGVSLERAITTEPAALHFGDWTAQGYLHYAGSMIYHASLPHVEGQRAALWLGQVSAVDVAVRVNGALAGHIPWQSANGLELTGWLKAGQNALEIEVVGSPRNMLGPLHLAAGREEWTDWRSFRRTDQTYTPEYVVQPWGLLGQARVWRQ